MMAIPRISSLFARYTKSGAVIRAIATGPSVHGNTGPLSQKGSTKAKELGLPEEPNTAGLFTEEHQQMRDSLKKLIDTEINPFVDEWEEAGEFPAHTVFKKLGNAGFLGVNKPEKYGGLGLDYSFALAIAEELGHINCGAIPMAIGVQTDMATPALTRYGNEQLKQDFLVPAIAGDMVTSIAVSESSAGSDVSGIKTTAVKKGDDYVINGSKMWITSGFQSDWLCLLANTGDGPVHQNKSLIVVPTDTPGLHRAKKISKLGMYSSDTAEIFLEDVRVPQSYRIGDENMGFVYQMQQFQLERLFAASSILTTLDKIIKETAEYSHQRKTFGYPVIYNQSVHFRLAELQTEVEALRALIYRTVAKYVGGEEVTYLASMCKLKAGRLAREVSDSCLQYWGGMGFTNDVKISRFYRDLRLVSIGGGADEMMLNIICKYMGNLPPIGKQK